MEGFNPKGMYNSPAKLKLLEKNKIKLIQFSKRFPKAKSACDKELKVVIDAIDRLKNGELYKFGKWQNPKSPTVQKTNEAKVSKSPQLTLDNFKTRSGLVIKSGRVLNVEGDRVSVSHDGGITGIEYRDLPDDIRKKLGLSDEGARKARSERAAKKLINDLARIEWEAKERRRKAPTYNAKVLQVVGTDARCSFFGNRDNVMVEGANASGELTDDKYVRIKALKNGTYTYKTVLGASATIPKYLAIEVDLNP